MKVNLVKANESKESKISTAPKGVPIWGPGSSWGPFSDLGSPKGSHFFQGPHSQLRLKNVLKVRAAIIF